MPDQTDIPRLHDLAAFLANHHMDPAPIHAAIAEIVGLRAIRGAWAAAAQADAQKVCDQAVEIKRLRAALYPFARYSNVFPNAPDNTVTSLCSNTGADITMGHCHAARRALSPPAATEPA